MTKIFALQLLLVVVCAVVSLAIAAPSGLDQDNKSHRGFSNRLDRCFDGNIVYERYARPLIHAAYHAGRFVGNGVNPAEWARAKDQFSKFGTGQQLTDYLNAHRQAAPGLDPDNKSHRGFSDSLDNRFGGNRIYESIARPVIHGAYHAGRYVGNGRNPEEWARAKDQFSKFGTGQQRTDYLRAHRQG